MKKIFGTMALMLVAAVAMMAQSSSDYSGKWTLDVKASELDQRNMVESIILTVTATDKDISVTTETVRAQRQGGAGAPAGQRGQGGGQGARGQGMGPGLMSGDGTVKYTLDGKTHTESEDTQMASIETSLTGNKTTTGLDLISVRKMSSPVGEVALTTTEKWSLSDGGNTLTIKREIETPRGKMNSVLVFKKG